jgi:hypothetical protein
VARASGYFSHFSANGDAVVSTLKTAGDANASLAPRTHRAAPFLVLASYLLAAYVVTWHIWAHPSMTSPTDGSFVKNDVLVDYWFLRYAATAVAHGHLPALITTAVNYPQGISTMWNNTLPLPAIVLTPVTLLAGPVFSLAVLLTLGFFGSAATMFFVLRRWNASIGAAALGGAIFGFCPALMVAAEDHYQLQFMVLPPLIIHFVLRLATRRGNPVRTGVLLGVMMALQIYISEEMLLFTGIAAAALLLLLALHRPADIARNALPAVAGALIAAVIVLIACGAALFVQLNGRLTETGTPWQIGKYGNHETDLYTAPISVALNHGLPRYLQFLGAQHIWPLENYAYLGWPVLAGLLLITVTCWRDLRVRIPALAFAAIELCGMGGHRQHLFGLPLPASAMPWHYIGQLPLFHEAVVNRLSLPADGLAAVVIAFGADHVAAAWRRQEGWRRPAVAAVAGVSLAALIAPIIPRPVQTATAVPAPAGWTQVLTALHLRAGAPVLVLPLNGGLTMSWQATTDVPISIIGGYCIAPNHHGVARECQDASVWTHREKSVANYLTRLSETPPRPGPRLTSAAAAVRQWRAAAILCVNGSRPLVAYLLRLLGQPTASHGGVLGWRLVRPGYIRVPRTDPGHHARGAHRDSGSKSRVT